VSGLVARSPSIIGGGDCALRDHVPARDSHQSSGVVVSRDSLD
jgi:hypothetical protein